MLYAKDFRKIARESLKGKWILAVLVCLVAAFMGANQRRDSVGIAGRGAKSILS